MSITCCGKRRGFQFNRYIGLVRYSSSFFVEHETIVVLGDRFLVMEKIHYLLMKQSYSFSWLTLVSSFNSLCPSFSHLQVKGVGLNVTCSSEFLWLSYKCLVKANCQVQHYSIHFFLNVKQSEKGIARFMFYNLNIFFLYFITMVGEFFT